tara:strand:+ start:2267 stop:3202 length:936 start_codon:yes stop_codon:yes gene_type:complete
MAVEIKSGTSSDLLTIDPNSKALRVTNYDSEGEERLFHPLPVAITTSPVTQVDNDVIDAVDVGEYKWVSLQLAGTFVADIQFQGSNDNGTFYNIVAQNPEILSEPYVTSISGPGIVKIPILYKFLRARVTAYTSGTVEGIAFGYKEANDSGQISSTGTVDGTVGVNNFPATQNVSGTVALGAGTEAIGSVKFLPAIATEPIYHKFISSVGVNAVSLKSSAGNIGILHIVNGSAGLRYFKLYNQTTTPNVGTDVPMITVAISPASGSTFILPALVGINFDVGIAYACLLAVADDGTTPFTVAGEVTAMIAYT